jgi:ankyrin repeat protein
MDRERRRALETLPKDLFETYRRILDRVNDSTAGNQCLVEKTLRWLAFTEKPLTVDALTTAVAIEIGSTHIDQDDLPDEESLLWWCSSLVSKDKKTGFLALSHFTVKEFLMDEKLLAVPSLRHYYMNEDISNAILAKVCLTYLGFRDFSLTSRSRTLDTKQKLEFYPLLKYAATCWPEHSSWNDEDDILFDLKCRLINPLKSANFMLWLDVFFWGRKKETPKSASTLHLAASLGLTRICQWLIDKNTDIDFNDTMLGSPLICAIRGSCRWGDPLAFPTLEIVQLLLAHGASASTKMAAGPADFSGMSSGFENLDDITLKVGISDMVTPMSLTLDMADEHELSCSVFKHLLNSGTFSSVANSAFWSRRPRNLREGDNAAKDWIELFTELLRHPSASSLDSESKEEMLNYIAKYGKGAEDENLVADHAMTGQVFKSIESVAQLVISAAENGQTHLIISLIEQHSNPRALSQGLAAAAELGQGEIVDILLEYCPLDDPAVFSHVQTAWMGAARFGNAECLKIFLKHNIDVNSVTETLDSPLAGPRTLRDCSTALAQAVVRGTLQVVEFFSTVPNADFELIDDKGCNLLHLAVQAPLNRTEVVSVLLSKSLNPLESSADGRTVLHHLLGNKYPLNSKDLQLIQLFIDHGCSIDAVDHEGHNLMHALFCRPVHYVEYLESTIALLIGDGAMWLKPRKDGYLPVQFAIRAQLPSPIIRMALPETISLWNSAENATFSPLHEAALCPNSPRLPGPKWMPRPPPPPPGSNVRPFIGKLPAQPIYPCEEDTLRVLKVLLEVDGINVNVVDEEGKTPLLIAASSCWSGSGPSIAQTLKELLEKGSDAKICDAQKWAALHYTAAVGFEAGLLELLRFSPDLNDMTLDGQTPLHVAITRGYDTKSAIKILLQAADNDIKSNNIINGQQWTRSGLLSIHLAAQIGQTSTIQLLNGLGQITNINVLSSNTEKSTPLHLAISPYSRHPMPMMHLLLSLGANVNSTNRLKQTPLHIAAREGLKDAVELLIGRGASLTAEDSSGIQPWMSAVLGGHKELRVLLEKATQKEGEKGKLDNVSRGMTIRLSGNPSAEFNQTKEPTSGMQTPMESPEPPNAVKKLADTFRRAVEDGDEYLCRMLLASGIDPNTIVDDDKRTALHVACGSGWMDVVKQLLTSGANISLRSSNGNQPVHIAAINGFSNIIKILVQAGSSITERNMEMQTPLHLASEEGHVEAARTILDLSTDDEGKDFFKDSLSIMLFRSHV